jgi:hypothetical protein
MTITINGTTGIAGVDGSAGTPSYQGSDTNTGIFFPAADTIAFGEGGAEAMRIDSDGDVGIGTTSPTTKLEVNGNVLKIYDQSTANANLVIRNTTTGNALGFTLQQDGVNSLFYNSSNGYMAFATNATERARILSTGQVLIDRTTNTASGKLEVYGDSDGSFNPLSVIQGAAGSTSRTSISFYRVSASGNVGTITTTNTATAYNTSSDYRLKENIQPMQNALGVVAQLNPVTYKWKSNGSAGQGFIAHELQEVVPDCVSGEKDAVDAEGNPQYQGVDTSFLVATLTAAIQELKAELDTVKAQNAAFEARLAALEAK